MTLVWSMLGLLALMLAASLYAGLYSGRLGERKITQEDINAAVLKTLENTQLPSAAAKAYEAIIPSVVRPDASAGPTAKIIIPNMYSR